VEKRKISCPFRESNPSSPAHSYSLFIILDLSWLPETKLEGEKTREFVIVD
jgi:hypothetical protein